MARKPRQARVHGPYEHGQRWRVVVVRADGRRDARTFATEGEARKLIADITRKLAGSIPVKDAIDQYETWLKSTGVRTVTWTTARSRLDRALGHHLAMPVSSITPARAAAIYDRLRKTPIPGSKPARYYSVQTHRHTLAELRRWYGWLSKEGMAKGNPFTDVEPQGRPNRGKPQLRVEESRRLVAACVKELAQGDGISALQPALCLLMGLRASEVAQLQCRDVDDDGRLLWVAQTRHKTESSRRTMEVPRILQATLAGLSRDEEGHTKVGQLIPGATRYTVHWHVKRLCVVAKVPPVSPHGLRGTHATLATSAGATAELVMAALGHTSTEVARRHYTDQTVATSMRGRKVVNLLQADQTVATSMRGRKVVNLLQADEDEGDK